MPKLISNAEKSWAEDYLLFGETSYAYVDKRIYNKLCLSEEAINRPDLALESLNYISNHTTYKNRIGEWFSKLYGIEEKDTLKNLTNFESVLNSDAAVGAVIDSTTAMGYISSINSMESAMFNNTNCLKNFCKRGKYVDRIVADETMMGLIVADNDAIDGLLSREDNVNLLNASSTALSAFKTKEAAVSKYTAKIGGLDYTAYSGISSTLNAISDLATLFNNDTVVDLVFDSVVTNTVASNEEAIGKIIDSSTVMAKLADNSSAITTMLNNTNIRAKIFNSTIATTAVRDSSTAMGIVAGSSTIYNSMYAVTAAMDIIGSSATAVTTLVSNSSARSAMYSSTTAMDSIAANTTAMETIVNNSTAFSYLKSSTAALNRIIAGYQAGKNSYVKQYLTGTYQASAGRASFYNTGISYVDEEDANYGIDSTTGTYYKLYYFNSNGGSCMAATNETVSDWLNKTGRNEILSLSSTKRSLQKTISITNQNKCVSLGSGSISSGYISFGTQSGSSMPSLSMWSPVNKSELSTRVTGKDGVYYYYKGYACIYNVVISYAASSTYSYELLEFK